MTILEVIAFILAIGSLIFSGFIYHRNSVIGMKHEYELKELEALFTNYKSSVQSIITEYESYISAYQNYFIRLNEIIHISNKRLKQIDEKGSFKSDDEVGFFFKNLMEIQNTLNEFDFTKSIIKSQENDKNVVIGPEGQPIPKENYISQEKVQEILSKK